jgi:hypothetical protein
MILYFCSDNLLQSLDQHSFLRHGGAATFNSKFVRNGSNIIPGPNEFSIDDKTISARQRSNKRSHTSDDLESLTGREYKKLKINGYAGLPYISEDNLMEEEPGKFKTVSQHQEFSVVESPSPQNSRSPRARYRQQSKSLAGPNLGNHQVEHEQKRCSAQQFPIINSLKARTSDTIRHHMNPNVPKSGLLSPKCRIQPLEEIARNYAAWLNSTRIEGKQIVLKV